MPNKPDGQYRASGTEELGSDPTTKRASSPDSPSAKAKAAGGTANLRGETETKRAKWNETPGAGAFKGQHPAKVDSFTDDRV